MISPNKIIVNTSLAQRLKAKNLIEGIRDIGHQTNLGSSTPLIKDLRMEYIFKNKVKEKRASITDLVLSVL